MVFIWVQNHEKCLWGYSCLYFTTQFAVFRLPRQNFLELPRYSPRILQGGVFQEDVHPGISFGLKFIPNQSDLFRNLFPRRSELIRVNPKKVFNLVRCNSVKNQSVSIPVNPRLWIRMNPDQSFSPHESEVGILRIDSDWVFRLNHSDLGFIWIKNFFRIHSDWKSRIESDWFGLNFG